MSLVELERVQRLCILAWMKAVDWEISKVRKMFGLFVELLVPSVDGCVALFVGGVYKLLLFTRSSYCCMTL